MNTNDALVSLKNNVLLRFNTGEAMPVSCYISDEFMQLEQEKIFSRSWISAGRADTLAKPGDYLTLNIAGEPIIIIRERENQLVAFSNVCRHRMSLLLEGKGNVKAISCPYHAWTYSLTGELLGAPLMEQNQAFCKSDIKLPSIRCVDWNGWIMLTLDPDLPLPHDSLQAIDEMAGYLDVSSYTETFREELQWNTNWKILAENFMESYHLPACHSKTIGGAVSFKDMICPEGLSTFNYHSILKDEQIPLARAHPSNTILTGTQRNKTWLFAVYPSLLITLTPGYFWYLSLFPEGTNQVRIIYGGGFSPDFMADPDIHAHEQALKTLLDEVNLEDKFCTERVWKGMQSRFATPGKISHLERPNYDFAKWLSMMMNN